MKFKVILAVISIIIMQSSFALAEAPCNAVGHETLQGAYLCAKVMAVQSASTSSHRPLINSMMASPMPAHPYPYAPVPSSGVAAVMLGNSQHGYGMDLIYPMGSFLSTPYNYYSYPWQ